MVIARWGLDNRHLAITIFYRLQVKLLYALRINAHTLGNVLVSTESPETLTFVTFSVILIYQPRVWSERRFLCRSFYFRRCIFAVTAALLGQERKQNEETEEQKKAKYSADENMETWSVIQQMERIPPGQLYKTSYLWNTLQDMVLHVHVQIRVCGLNKARKCFGCNTTGLQPNIMLSLLASYAASCIFKTYHYEGMFSFLNTITKQSKNISRRLTCNRVSESSSLRLLIFHSLK